MPAALEPFFALFPIHPQDRDHEGDPPTQNNRAGVSREQGAAVDRAVDRGGPTYGEARSAVTRKAQ